MLSNKSLIFSCLNIERNVIDVCRHPLAVHLRIGKEGFGKKGEGGQQWKLRMSFIMRFALLQRFKFGPNDHILMSLFHEDTFLRHNQKYVLC